jgi:hypothetical protein
MLTSLKTLRKLVVLAMLLLGPTEASARLIGDPEILRQAAAIYRSNRGKLVSWQGQVRIADQEEIDGRETKRIDSQVVFFASIPEGQLRFDWNITFRSGGSTLNPITSRDGLISEDRYISVTRHYDPQKKTPGIFIEPATVRSVTDEFNPMYYFGYQGENLSDTLLWHADHAETSGDIEWVVSRNGPTVTLRCDTEGLYNEYALNLDTGANLLHYRAGDATEDATVEWTYELSNSVWIPKTWSRVKRERWRIENKKRIPSMDEKTKTRTVTWTESKVNEPIADSEFSMEKLGIKSGELVVDRITKSDYRYNSVIEDTEAGGHFGVRSVFIAANVAILVLIGSYLFWRRRRAS